MISQVILTSVILTLVVPAISYDYCEDALLYDRSISITATSKLPGRGAEHARLDSQNAWSPSNAGFDQYLTIDLKKPRNLTSIATRGRSHSYDFVKEYVISFGFNGLDFADYKENDGSRKLFKGNKDGDSIHSNTFDTPIIAQFIRINPTRWRDRIAMRVEVYGCDYVADTISFNGTAMVYKNLTYYPVQSRHDEIKFRFRTTDANGIILYSRGTQGDYFALQIVENRMLLNINLGSGIMTSMSAGSLLDDSIWHDVTITRTLNVVKFVVDRVEVKELVKGDFQQLDLNRMLYIGGVPYLQEGLVIAKNFTGCMENFYLNHTNVIRELKEPHWDVGERFYKYHTVHQCADSQIIPITFLSPKSYLKLKGYEGVRSMNVSLEFRTYESNGLIMYHRFLNANSYIKLYLEKGKIWIELQTDKTPKLNLDNFPNPFNDGMWHRCMVTVGTDLITLTMDDVLVKTIRLISIDTGSMYIFGGPQPETPGWSPIVPGFIGCMRQISIDGNYRMPLNWKMDEDYCCKEEPIILNACQMTDRCNPNPCEHGGICKQDHQEFECDCDATGYTGSVCHTSLHPISCQSYRNTHGANQRTELQIDPDGSGELGSFYVTCQYYQDGLTKTIIRHKHDTGSTTVNGYAEPGSFVQTIEYDGSMLQMEAVINRSASCEQFIKFECKNSRLFNTPVPETAIFLPNSWWVSRKNQPMDYWGDSVEASRKCECGIHNNCVEQDKWCNCDDKTTMTSKRRYRKQQADDLTAVVAAKRKLPHSFTKDDSKDHSDHPRAHEPCFGTPNYKIQYNTDPPPFVYKKAHNIDNYDAARLSTRKDNKYHCDFPNCQFTANSTPSVQGHNEVCHTPDEDKPWQCDVCQKKFMRERMLKAHQRMHNIGEKVQCPFCTYSTCQPSTNIDTWLSDEGQIREIEYLPVLRLHIGDTGTPVDDKMAKFTLGPLICQGDALYDNVVTFRLPDAALNFPLPDLGHSWDIYFEFKTTTMNAVMLHATGRGGDYIKVSLIGGDQLQFQVESGSGPVGGNVETSNKLNDNEWHTVHIEKNRKQARLVVDGSFQSAVMQPPGQVRAIELDRKRGLFLGATVERRSGYVGCMRALTVNGVMMDIAKALEANTYGVGPGCRGKCDRAPCLNNGTCFEGYDHYTCDCRFTAFKGPICADEIGVTMQSNEMVRYDFLGSYKSTIAEKIRVGFTTTEPKGFLIGVFSNITGEYLTLQVSNSGHLRLVFDFGFERQELIFPDQNFATGQYHDVQISRQDSGTKLVMKVDNFEPKIVHFNVKTSADAQFNNIQYLYIGKNESMREGFIGCVSRVEFDDIYPLKYYFQENRPRNIRSYPESLSEDFCGVEPVTHPPDIVETAPLPDIDEEILRKAFTSTTTSAILGGILGIIFLAIVIMALLIGRYLSKHKGEYLTQEDEGAIGALDPNSAVVEGVTGHHVTKKKEWYI